MTFNSPGYLVVVGGYLVSTNLQLTTNADATLKAGLIYATSITKTGAGTLHLGSGTTAKSVYINAGELEVASGTAFITSSVALAQQGNAVLSIPSTMYLQNLSGGGIVRPAVTGGSTLMINPSYLQTDFPAFNGVIEDNGAAGKLSLTVLARSQVLGGENSYSGSTSIMSLATLELRDNGSILSTPEIIVEGHLFLNNEGIANANRLSDSTTVKLDGGSLSFQGNSRIKVEESIGKVSFSGAADINSFGSGGGLTPKLTIGNLDRQGHATLAFANGDISANLANTATGILSPYYTSSREWATADTDGTIRKFSDYTTDISSATAMSHVKIAEAGTTQLTKSEIFATLNIRNNARIVQILDLNSFDLTLGDAGIISSASIREREAEIRNGRILISRDELVVSNWNELRISASIVETGAPLSLTKTGTGVLKLNGANSYSGDTFINEGTLSISSENSLGSGRKVELTNGSLQITGAFATGKSIEGKGTVEVTGSNIAAFAGGHSAWLSKTGTGGLKLEDHVSDSVYFSAGNLTLINTQIAQLDVYGGKTLDASGAFDSVSIGSLANLEIGSSFAEDFNAGSLYLSSLLNVFFDLGANESDHIAVTDYRGLEISPSAKMSFTFRDIGGATVGQDYVLLSTSGSWLATLANFGFSPASISAGWDGTFTKTEDGLLVRFTSVPAAIPEPGSVALACLGGAFAILRCLRRKN